MDRTPEKATTSSQPADPSVGAIFWVLILAAVHLFVSAPFTAVAQNSGTKKANLGDLKKNVPIPTDVPIVMNADHTDFDVKRKVYTARGNVRLVLGNYRVRADSVSVDAKSNTVTARGKVLVRLGGEVIEADKFKFNIGKFTGLLVNGKLRITRHNIYLEGKKLEKTGDTTYRIKRGSYTTCNGIPPDWRIYGRNLDITLDGYATLKHGLFYVKDVPVLYLPWLIYPTKQHRTTGFLMPTLSSSTVKGFDFRFPFFWNISPSFDATIVPRICTKRAAQTSLEFRYFPYENISGRLYGEYTYDWHFATDTGPRKHRFYVTWGHNQMLPGDLRFKVNANWLSDRDYFEFWGGLLDKRKRVRYLESIAVLNRQWNDFLFQAQARHFDDLDVPDNAVTVQNLPVVTGTAFNQQIPYTPFYFSSSLDYSNFFAGRADEKWLGSRLKMDAKFSLPIALGRYLKLEPSMTFLPKAYMARYWENDRVVNSVNTVRTDIYQVNTDAYTDFLSLFSGPFLGFPRVGHTIRPRVSWVFRPRSVSETYPVFDDSDRVDRESLLTAELRHTLTGRLGPGSYLDFLTFKLAQGYDFYAGPAPAGSLTEPLSLHGLTNTRAEFTLRPHSLIDLLAQAEYDPVLNRARKYSLDLGLMDHRGDLLRVVHQFTDNEKNEDLNRQTNVNLQVKLTSDLECFFQTQYTHQFDFSYFTSFGLSYHPQCWSVALKYSEAREQDPVVGRIKETDQTVFFTLSIGGLGPVYSMSRDWKEISGQTREADAPADR